MMQNFSTEDAVNLAALAAALYAGWSSKRADRQTRSTGNGFAAYVKTTLAAIQTDLTDVKQTGIATKKQLDAHMRDHATGAFRE